VDKRGHAAVGVGRSRPFLAPEQGGQLGGVRDGGVVGDGVGEHPHAVPRVHGEPLLGEGGRQVIDAVGAGIRPDAVGIGSRVERLPGGHPVSQQAWAHCQRVAVADQQRHQAVRSGC
jgi:hypothetical protein